MLRCLSIRDFVIVDRMELQFGPGFTVLTGETGAGKSILIDALSLALGERGDAGVVRAGRERAEITAEFDLSALPELQKWLCDSDLEGDPGICLLRRVIDAGARSRGFINGHAATLQQMREAGDRLVDIHGQHEHQSLLRPNSQRELLDAFGGQKELAGKVAAAYRQWQALRQQRLEWEQNAATFAQEREHLAWQARELATLNFSQEEWLELQADHSRLSHAASLLEGAESALDGLSESEGACLSRLNLLTSRLRDLAAYDAGLQEILAMLEPAQIHIQEAVYALRRYRERLELDPDSLRQMESRLEAIHSTARKNRVKPEELPSLLQKCQARLQELGEAADPAQLEKQEQAAKDAFLQLAGKLSQARKQAASSLSGEVSAAMQTLAMGAGKFAVALTAVAGGNAHGLEQVEFQVAAHAKLPLRPLAKVASGGELSRISLAIQVITSKVAAVPTLIFDEVDSGIGGRVAEIVGRMLKKLGAERQVMCVTHLPQVAAAGDQQWQVVKSASDGAVLSRISVLDKHNRVEEIARMLGGVKITETTRKHAAEMLGVRD